MFDPIRKLFMVTWLWSIFAGFYLVAYSFWVPKLFSNLVVAIPVLIVILILGLSQLFDGFSRAIELQFGGTTQTIPYKRIWHLLGGVVLLGFVIVYIPPNGRVVPHWPLDLGITIASGVVIIAYSIMNK